MIDDDDNDDVLYLNETPLSERERERDWEDAPCPINFKSLKKVVLTFFSFYNNIIIYILKFIVMILV